MEPGPAKQSHENSGLVRIYLPVADRLAMEGMLGV